MGSRLAVKLTTENANYDFRTHLTEIGPIPHTMNTLNELNEIGSPRAILSNIGTICVSSCVIGSLRMQLRQTVKKSMLVTDMVKKRTFKLA